MTKNDRKYQKMTVFLFVEEAQNANITQVSHSGFAKFCQLKGTRFKPRPVTSPDRVAEDEADDDEDQHLGDGVIATLV
jgi:hypothetical protein